MAAAGGGSRPPRLRPDTSDDDRATGPIPPAAARDAFDEGLAAYLDGDPTVSQAALLSALDLDPTFDEAHYLLALIHQDAGRLEEALDALDAVLASGAEDAPRVALQGEARRLRGLVALRLRRAGGV